MEAPTELALTFYIGRKEGGRKKKSIANIISMHVVSLGRRQV